MASIPFKHTMIQKEPAMQTLQCFAEDEPEEGEIVDDLEFIISSDEEYNMRQRIRELEAENEELEKIEKISGIYNNDYTYTDKDQCTSRTSRSRRNSSEKHERLHRRATELHKEDTYASPTITRHRRRARSHSKRLGPRDRHRQRSKYTYHADRKQSTTYYSYAEYKKNNQPKRYTKTAKEHRQRRKSESREAISLDSTDTPTEDMLDNSNSRESILNREELQRALARNVKLDSAAVEPPKENTEFIELSEETQSEVEPNNLNIPVSDNSTTSLGEQELRLIALKSAYMKKHVKRKQRDEEVAYSPTDFNELFNEHINGVETMDLDDDDMENMPIIDTSPFLSPKQVPSPITTEDEITLNHQLLQEPHCQHAVNTKPVDMDIATSEESNMDETNMWLETIPLPSQVPEGLELPPPPVLPFNYHNNYGMTAAPLTLYMPEMQYEQFLDEIPPPPPPFRRLTPEIVMNINDNAVDHQWEQCANAPADGDTKYAETPQQIPTVPAEEDDEEEAEALRALLLAKFQPAKAKALQINQSKTAHERRDEANAAERANSPTATSTPVDANQHAGLPSRLQTKPTESILKDAVRRFQAKFNLHNDNEIRLEADLGDSNAKENFGWDHFTVTLNGDKDYRFSDFHLSLNTADYNELAAAEIDGALHSTLSKFDQSSQWNLCSHDIVTFKPTEDYTTNHNLDVDRHDYAITQKNSSTDVAHETPKSEPAVSTNVPENTANVSAPNKTKVVPNKTSLCAASEETAVAIGSSIAQSTELCILNGLTRQQIAPTQHSIANTTSEMNEKSQKIVALQTVSPAPLEIPIVTEQPTKTTPAEMPQQTMNTQPPKLVETVATRTAPKPTITPVPVQSRLNKIVKPNKIINTNSTIKRKAVDATTSTQLPIKKTRSDATTTIVAAKASVQQSKTTSNTTSRLITNSDLCAIKVPRLVINVRCSETETSDADSDDSDNNHGTPKYCDNASPLSLNIDSASQTPQRCNTPEQDTQRSPASMLAKQNFEEKLNTFLRTVRSQVDCKLTRNSQKPAQPTHSINRVKIAHAVGVKTPDITTPHISTPVAVRHLPTADQHEYRRLLHRMNMLEKQRQAKLAALANGKENVPAKSTTTSTVRTQQSADAGDKDTAVTTQVKNKLIRSVLVKNAEKKGVTTAAAQRECVVPPANTSTDASPNSDTAEEESSKAELLSSYETSIKKIGAGINAVLDSSLVLVEEAKSTKITKLRCELRMEQLRAELKALEHKHKQAQQKISQISPQICTANNKINALKQKQLKLETAARKLGTSIHGEQYSTCSALRTDIRMKSKHLASQIKYVNSLKACDIKKLDAMQATTDPLPAKTIQTNVLPEEQNKDDNIDEVTADEQQTDPHEQHGEEENGNKTLCIAGNSAAVQPDENSISDYISPLAFKHQNSKLDPFATVCPYELNGECKDTDCKYLHLNAGHWSC